MAEGVLEDAKEKLTSMGIEDVDTYIEYVTGKVKVYDLENIPDLPPNVYDSMMCSTRNKTKNRSGSYGQFCKVNIGGKDYGIKTQILKEGEKFDILLEIWTQVFLTCDPTYGKHIPEIHFVYKSHNKIYIVMTILKEDTLYSVIQKLQRKYFWYEVPYLQKIVDILEHFDKLYNFRHRDLHVSNILIDEDVYIIDFGRACFSANGNNFNVEKYGNECTNSYDIPMLLLSIASYIYVHIQNNDIIERSLIDILLLPDCGTEQTHLHHCVYDMHVKGNKTYMAILSKFDIENIQQCLKDDNNDKRKNNGYFISLDNENDRLTHLNILKRGWTELHWVSHMNRPKEIQPLLERGAAVDAALTDGTTPLYSASENGHIKVVEELLKHGAAVDAAKNDSATSLYIASQQGHLEVVKVLLAKGAAVDAKTNVGATPLYIASEKGHIKVVEELLKDGAAVDAAMKGSWTPLLIASWKGYLEVVRALLARDADVNAATKGGYMPLYNASMMNHFKVVQELFLRGAKLPTDIDKLQKVLEALKNIARYDKNFKAELYERAKKLYRNNSNNNPSKQNTIAALAGMSYKNFETYKKRTNLIGSIFSRKKVGGRHRTRKTARH